MVLGSRGAALPREGTPAVGAEDARAPVRAHRSRLTPRKSASAGPVLGLPDPHTLTGLVKTSFMYSATVMGPVDLILYTRCCSIGVAGLFSTGSFPELKCFPPQRQGLTAKNTSLSGTH